MDPRYNPWGTPIFPDHAAFGTGSPAETSTQPAGLHTFMTGLYNGLENLARRAIGNSQSALDTGTYYPRPALEAALLPMGTGAIAGVPVKGAETVMGAGLIRGVKAAPKDFPDLPDVGPVRAYHGSPHDFDRFDLSKIGSGEGAQAYGHGLYFAENEGVARGYRDALAPIKLTDAQGRPPLTDVWGEMTSAARKAAPDVHYSRANQIAEDVHKGLRNGDDIAAFRKFVNQSDWSASDKAMYRAALDEAQKYNVEKTGKMYEVNLNADPAHFLDWDKPLAGQSQTVRDAFHYDKAPDQVGNLTGMDAYMKVGQGLGQARFNSPEVARHLSEAGIPGIRYLDQGSRMPARNTLNAEMYAAEQELKSGDLSGAARQAAEARLSGLRDEFQKSLKGTSNYVMFDDKLIDILRKYGIAGMTAPPIFAATMSEQKQ